MKSIEVVQMESQNGNPVANQFLIYTKQGVYFQSYSSIIAFIPNNNNHCIKLDINLWDYSKTTGKYRNLFLSENINETRKKIENGTYQLINLN